MRIRSSTTLIRFFLAFLFSTNLFFLLACSSQSVRTVAPDRVHAPVPITGSQRKGALSAQAELRHTQATARKQAQVSQLQPSQPQPSPQMSPMSYLEAADRNLKALAVPTSQDEIKAADAYKVRATEIIEGKLTPDEIKHVCENFTDSFLRARSCYRMAQLGLEHRDQDLARKYFGKTLNIDSKSDLGKRAQDLLSQLEAIRKVEPKTIGVVLPLTGKFSNIAQKTLRGVQMGLGLYGNNISTFTLAVIDSEGNPDTARRGVERLVKEDNAIAIIGSVLSKNASAVAAKSAELGIPSITLAQKSGVTEIAPTVFRNSLTSEMQVHQLVKTAIVDMGLRRFAVLYPNDQYGVEFTNIFWDEVLAYGGEIRAAQIYSPKETDFRFTIQKMVGTFYLEDRADEYKTRLKAWSEAQTKKSARNLPPEDLLPPIVDFDAIFIPDSAKSLGQIAAMLSFNGIKDVSLLGTNLWNVPDIAKRAGSFSKNLIFVDSVSSSASEYQTSSFIRDYKSLFGEDPSIFEIQGYDSALTLRQLISSGASSREGLTAALSKLNNLPGSIGSLSMSEDREILRPVQTFKIESGNVIPFQK